MAKNKKLSYNEIPNLQEDWGLDPRNGLKYSGQSVQAFIKRFLQLTDLNDKEKASRIGFKNMTVFLFASAEDKAEWQNNGLETWIDSEPLVFVGTERKIQITNVDNNNSPYFTTAQEKAEISVTFKSLEKDVMATEYTEIVEDVLYTVSVDKGATGHWVVIANDVMVKYGDTYTIDVKKYLAIGANRIVIKAVGSSTGAAGQLNITANLTAMYLQPSNFAWNMPFIEGQEYSLGGLSIGGNIDKTLHIKVSNENGYSQSYEQWIGTNQYTNVAYYYKGLVFPSGGTGIYNVEMWLDAGSVQSEHLIYNIMCIAATDTATAQLVAISNMPNKVVNYADNKLFDYVVYDKGKAIASPQVVIKSLINQNPTVILDEILNDVPTKAINSYKMGVEIESQETNIQLTADITLGSSKQSVVYQVDNSLSYPPTSGFTFYLNPTLRNNAQENREIIINTANSQEIQAEWTKMAWSDGVDGWTVDDEGRKCLFIPARSKVVIDLKPMSRISKDITIEFTYKVKNVADYKEAIITICDTLESNFKGIKITPGNILVHSADLRTSDLTQGLNLQDEVSLNIIVTIIKQYRETFGNLCQIYVNGEKARSFEFKDNDSWNNEGKLTFGSMTSDLYIYNTKVYPIGFGKEDGERNYIASLNLSEEKKRMYELINSIRGQLGDIDYDAVKYKYNTMVVEMLDGAELPHKGLSKEYSAWCNVEFNFLQLPMYYQAKAWRFILEKCKIEGQGTTSMNYWLWNLRFRIDKSDNLIVIYPDGTEEVII